MTAYVIKDQNDQNVREAIIRQNDFQLREKLINPKASESAIGTRPDAGTLVQPSWRK
jgi:hypothetical protein